MESNNKNILTLYDNLYRERLVFSLICHKTKHSARTMNIYD